MRLKSLKLLFRLELVEIGLVCAGYKIDMSRAGLLAFYAERILARKTSEAEIVIIVPRGANQRLDGDMVQRGRAYLLADFLAGELACNQFLACRHVDSQITRGNDCGGTHSHVNCAGTCGADKVNQTARCCAADNRVVHKNDGLAV